MELHTAFGIIAGVVFLGGCIPYILEIKRGNTKPNLASWIGWTFVLAVGSAAQIAKGTSWSVLLPIGGVLGDGLTAFFAFKYGYISFSTLDKVCLFLGALAILLWTVTNEPLVALVLAVSADVIVGIPTVLKTYRDPTSEGLLPWGLFTLGSLIAFGATAQFDLNNLAYPVELVLLNGVIFLFALRGRLKTV